MRTPKRNKKNISIAIVMPAYNEAKVIGSVIQEIYKHPAFTQNMLVVVVNDGSTDKTNEVIKKISKNKKIIVVEHIVNMGAGAATRTGLATAREHNCDVAITVDADGQHKIDNVFFVLEEALESNADLVIGSRLKSRKGMPKNKIFGNIILNIMSYILLGIVVSDSQSGLRVYNRKALENLSYYSNGYAFCSEMIWRAKKLGLKVEEKPIDSVYTDYSKNKGQKNVAGFFAIIGSLTKHRLMGLLNE